MGNKFSLKLFSGLALAAGLCACGESSRDTAGGVSEETEGIYAIENKTIAGVSQKGPFVTGSDVYLMETKADSSLEPTGKKFYAMIRNDKGEFIIENISLESPFVHLYADGYYKHERTNHISACPIHLNALSNIEKREKVNINLLTHFEYQRVLNLIESGKSFEEAKKQASDEILSAFGFDMSASAEDLDITASSEKDTALLLISSIIDNHDTLNQYDKVTESYCKETQNYIDNFSEDFADDGILSDSLLEKIIGNVYDIIQQNKDLYIEGNEYYFDAIGWPHISKFNHIFEQYIGIGSCDDHNRGEIVSIEKKIPIPEDSPLFDPEASYEYIQCDGYTWNLITEDEYEVLATPLEHKTGSMTDNRDGKKYRTTSFEYKGKKYEWMADNLLYTDSTIQYSDDVEPDNSNMGVYTWSVAMGLGDSLAEEAVDSVINSLDSIHQGICPEDWHIPASLEWAILLEYAKDPNSLFNENWKPQDEKFALSKEIYDVFNDRLDFNMDPQYNSYDDVYARYVTYPLDYKSLTDEKYARDYIADKLPLKNTNFFFVHFAIDDRSEVSYTYENRIGYVRCVKN